MLFEWDPIKASLNAKKHRVQFQEAASVFLDALALTYDDPDHSVGEEREITIGNSSRRRLLWVAHVSRAGKIRINARRATRREKEQYEKIIAEGT